jgi:hypothetical protein
MRIFTRADWRCHREFLRRRLPSRASTSSPARAKPFCRSHFLPRANKRRRGSGAPVASVLICGARKVAPLSPLRPRPPRFDPILHEDGQATSPLPSLCSDLARGRSRMGQGRFPTWWAYFFKVYQVEIANCWREDFFSSCQKKNSNLPNHMIWQVNFTKLLEMLRVVN